MEKTMSADELRQNIVEFLKEHKSATLATCKNNMPRSSPVLYFLGSGLDIYIISAGGEKFDAIKSNPNVCLLVNTEYISYKKIKGLQIFGKATTSLEDPKLLSEAEMYCPEPHLMEHEKDNIKIIKVVPEEIVYLDALNGDRTKQILKNNTVEIKKDRTLAFA